MRLDQVNLRPAQLALVGEVEQRCGLGTGGNEFALRFNDGEHEVTAFADGRAIIKGATCGRCAQRLFAISETENYQLFS